MRLNGIPVLLLFIGALGLMMLAPSLLAALERDWRSARLFLFAAVFTLFAAAMLAAAARRGDEDGGARSELLTLLGTFTVAPVFAAIPIWLILPPLGLSGAWFEAVSSLTTTGATLLSDPGAAPDALNLWRALLGWTGGLVILTAALAVLGPRGLIALPDGGAAPMGAAQAGRALALGPGGRRVLRAVRVIAPVYAGLTAALTVALAATGVPSFLALVHAMGVVSTSGISPLADGFAGLQNRWAEAVAVLFMVASATRLTYEAGRGRRGMRAAVRRDPELRLMAIAVGAVTAALFIRHWVGALDIGEQGALAAPALKAAWGGFATAVGFVTTTGYASMDWGVVQEWSLMENPGLILLGLASLGGGVATTAGGVKLFRAYALFRHGGAELRRLSHPSLVDGVQTGGGALTRQAVVNAWIFMMLWMAALAAVFLTVTLLGVGFEGGLAASIAALSNTGPLLTLAGGGAWTALNEPTRIALALAMVLGRIEVLVLVALFDPGRWRR